MEKIKYNLSKILESLDKGVNFALDDFEDNELIGQQTETINDNHNTYDFFIIEAIKNNNFQELNNVLIKYFYDNLEYYLKQFGLTLEDYYVMSYYMKNGPSINKNLTSFARSHNNIFTAKDKLNHLKYIVKSIKELKQIIKTSGINADLNYLDVSNITDMSHLFDGSKFNGNISEWDVSNVTNMSWMFNNSKFNGDISEWNVSNVKDMGYMFQYSKFNSDISKWDVSNVKDMDYMFEHSRFNNDISNWDVSNVENMWCMFNGSKFNLPIDNWDVHNVKDMSYMFADSPFNLDISKWKLQNGVVHYGIFENCPIKRVYRPKFK